MNFEFNVTVKCKQNIEAENKAEAIEALKESFEDDYSLSLTDDEIEFVF